MPLYKYKCELCNIEVEELQSVANRDDISTVINKYCKKAENFKTMLSERFNHQTPQFYYCMMKRVITNSTFKFKN